MPKNNNETNLPGTVNYKNLHLFLPPTPYMIQIIVEGVYIFNTALKLSWSGKKPHQRI
jgi:hydroxyacyl-ACP dehydratase HTD2-like protein with hotdog domain